MRLNPFAALSQDIAKRVLEDRRLRREADLRLARLLSAYKALAEDPRYLALYEDLKSVLGEQLHALIRAASSCPRCSALANRITVLQEVIAAPLETVWFEHAQDQTREDDSQDGEHALDD